MPTRPTTLRLFLDHCPAALEHYDRNEPIDRSHPVRFGVGTAAHEVLYAMGTALDVDALCVRLMASGRTGEDAEGPLAPDDVLEGRALAEAWVASDVWAIEDGIAERTSPLATDGAQFEVPRAFSAGWDPVPWDHPTCDRRTRTDYVSRHDEHGAIVVTVRDYKSSWQDTETALDSLQRRFQAVAAWKSHPDAACLRLEVANLRRRAIYRRTIWLDADGEATLSRWASELELVILAATTTDRRPRPGAGCSSCPYVGRCDAARALAAADDATDPGSVARRYLAATATATADRATLHTWAVAGPVDAGGLAVGIESRTSLRPRQGLTRASLDAYLARAGIELDANAINAITGWIATVGEPGISMARKMAKILPKDRRAAWLAEWCTEVRRPWFFVRDGGEG